MPFQMVSPMPVDCAHFAGRFFRSAYDGGRRTPNGTNSRLGPCKSYYNRVQPHCDGHGTAIVGTSNIPYLCRCRFSPYLRVRVCVCVCIYLRTRTYSKVPNYRSGRVATYDRTEPSLGTWTLAILNDIYNDGSSTWVVDLLLPPLLNWNSWMWTHRQAEGVLDSKSKGIRSNLISLGSDATIPPGLNTPHTLAASRYESGLDNSPMYDGRLSFTMRIQES